MPVTQSLNVVRFGPFQLDFKTGELYRGEHRVRLQEQPFQILKMLLARPGEVVSGEEIRKTLWSDDIIVEFDNSVHAAIKKLRVALGDSAENPTYIETLPRKGYRFIGVAEIPDPEQVLQERVANHCDLERSNTHGVEATALNKATKKYPLRWVVATTMALLLGAGSTYWILRPGAIETADAPLVVPFTTYPGIAGDPSFSPDGNLVAFGWSGPNRDNGDIYIKSGENRTSSSADH
jgi:DNA-binding winged helix-turn-helix (wHTH) protein